MQAANQVRAASPKISKCTWGCKKACPFFPEVHFLHFLQLSTSPSTPPDQTSDQSGGHCGVLGTSDCKHWHPARTTAQGELQPCESIMAPSSNTTTKAMQQNQPRPAMRKPVVPVIPITYTQRRKKAVEPEQPKKEPEPESVADESVSSPSLPFKTPLTGSPDTRNASDDHESSKQASPVVSALSTVATPPHEVEAEVPTSQDSLSESNASSRL